MITRQLICLVPEFPANPEFRYSWVDDVGVAHRWRMDLQIGLNLADRMA